MRPLPSPTAKGTRMTDTLRRVSLSVVTGVGLCLPLLPAGQAQAQAPQAPVRVAL